MLFFLNTVIFLLLGLVFAQDLKYRAVSWILFPLLALAFLTFNLVKISFMEVFNNVGMNVLFLSVIMLLVILYFSIKHKRPINIFKEMIGWGDLLFFFCLSVLLSPLNFILFLMISLLAIAMFGGIVILITKNKNIQIPLAGLQALMLTGLFILNLVFPDFKVNTDEWVITIL